MSKNLRAKSIKWLMNYYPVTADHLRDATKLECLEHSLKKWIGLTRLKSYGLMLDHDERSLVEDKTSNIVLRIDSGSCALCIKHYDAYMAGIDGYGIDCDKCPLAIHLGKPCDDLKDNLYMKSFINPSLMVKALRAAIKEHKENI